MYPKICNYCIQLYPKLQKCDPMCIPIFSSFVAYVLSSQSFIPLRLFPRDDEAVIFEAACYSSCGRWPRSHSFFFIVFIYHMCIPKTKSVFA